MASAILNDFLNGPLRSVSEALLAPQPFYGRKYYYDECKWGKATSNGQFYQQCNERAGPEPRFVPTDKDEATFFKKINGDKVSNDRKLALLMEPGQGDAVEAAAKLGLKLPKHVSAAYYHDRVEEYASALRSSVTSHNGKNSRLYPPTAGMQDAGNLEQPILVVDEISPTIESTDLMDFNASVDSGYFCKSPNRIADDVIYPEANGAGNDSTTTSWLAQKLHKVKNFFHPAGSKAVAFHPTFTFRDPIPGLLHVKMRDLTTGAVHWDQIFKMNYSTVLDETTEPLAPGEHEEAGESDLPPLTGNNRPFYPVCPDAKSLNTFHQYEITFKQVKPYRRQYTDAQCRQAALKQEFQNYHAEKPKADEDAVEDKVSRGPAVPWLLDSRRSKGANKTSSSDDEDVDAKSFLELSKEKLLFPHDGGYPAATDTSSRTGTSGGRTSPTALLPPSAGGGKLHQNGSNHSAAAGFGEDEDDKMNLGTTKTTSITTPPDVEMKYGNKGKPARIQQEEHQPELVQQPGQGLVVVENGFYKIGRFLFGRRPGGGDEQIMKTALDDGNNSVGGDEVVTANEKTSFENSTRRNNTTDVLAPLPSSAASSSATSSTSKSSSRPPPEVDSFFLVPSERKNQILRNAGRNIQLLAPPGAPPTVNFATAPPLAGDKKTAFGVFQNVLDLSGKLTEGMAGTAGGGGGVNGEDLEETCGEKGGWTSDANEYTDLVGRVLLSCAKLTEAHSTALPFDHTMM
ncbi:unnamed protein product [Amoebophrya sp. A120]|nr:unnamed protein product [Amoebophrya sp. A120]|eukprot:GSA120T00013666001.1